MVAGAAPNPDWPNPDCPKAGAGGLLTPNSEGVVEAANGDVAEPNTELGAPPNEKPVLGAGVDEGVGRLVSMVPKAEFCGAGAAAEAWDDIM